MSSAHTLTRNAFIKVLQQNSGRIDLNSLDKATQISLEATGLSVKELKRRIGSNGIINTRGEFAKLFSWVDGIDHNGRGSSISLGRMQHGVQNLTGPGKAFDILEKVSRRGASQFQPRQRIGRIAQTLYQRRGTVDVEALGSSLRKALSIAGISHADLLDVAGPNGLIRGRDEFLAFVRLLGSIDKNQSSETILLRNSDGTPTAVGHMIEAVQEDVRENRHLLRYQRPGQTAAPRQENLTIGKNARLVPDAERQQEVNLAMRGINQFDLFDDPTKAAKACFAAAVKQTVVYNQKTHGKHAARLHPMGEDVIQIGMAEDKNGRLQVDETRARLGRQYIDAYLDKGYPVLVGVSYADRSYNADRLTDHFVAIDGRNYDKKGRLYYTFKDPGDAGRSGRLYVDNATGKLFKQAEKSRKRFVRYLDYEVTQVRTYEGLFGC